MTLGVPAESLEGERRVAITPAVVPALKKLGLRVLVESGAGAAAGFPDSQYTDQGAEIASRDDALAAAILATVRVAGADPQSPDLSSYHAGQVVIGTAAPFAQPEVSAAVAKTRATLHALELVPRTTRAQSMDVLSSQANIAGYKAVLIAAEALQKVFPLLTTAAGTLAPAKVFVLGAGVAGLSAISTARRLGAVVTAYDVRAAAGEEVKSLGARFLQIDLDTGQEGSGSGAYASALSDEALKKQQALMTKTIAGSDVIVTTAQVQGAKAPTLVTAEQVAAMAPGSVIVDMAAEQGGNCELSRPGEIVETDNGVKVIGLVNVPSSVAHHASLVYAKNVANFIGLLITDGALAPDPEDDVVNESTVCRDGKIVNERVSDALGVGS